MDTNMITMVLQKQFYIIILRDQIYGEYKYIATLCSRPSAIRPNLNNQDNKVSCYSQ